MTTATREAYGKALAELMLEKEDIVVLDADLSKSTKTIEAKRFAQTDILILELPKAT